MQPPDTGNPGSAGPGKRATEIADLIEADLMKRGWPVGEIIGTFADLIETYGVSRAVVREAIGLLEHKMVVEMRHGPGGGIEVRAPVLEAVVGAISSYLDYTGVTDGELAEVRHRLLGLSARLAAERIDADGVRLLREVVERSRKLPLEEPSFRMHTLEIFSTVTELSKNPSLSLFWSALVQRVTAGLVGGHDVTAERHHEMAEYNLKIVDAVISGDGDLAESRMMQLLGDTYSDVAAPAERVGREESPALEGVQEAIAEIGIPLPAIDRDRRKKMPARVVRELLDEIAEKELGPGDVLGMERDLLERLAVSRSVFREAVRIIEFYGLAEMRRGPKGGLTVSEPDQAHIEEAIIRYLEYMGIELKDLLEVRIALELMNVEWAIERGGARLSVLREIVGQEEHDGILRRQVALHETLAELSGNRASRLLSNVLSKLLDRFVAAPTEAVDDSAAERAEIAARAQKEHQEIVSSVLAGDVDVARDRLRRHLEFVAVSLEATDATEPTEPNETGDA